MAELEAPKQVLANTSQRSKSYKFSEIHQNLELNHQIQSKSSGSGGGSQPANKRGQGQKQQENNQQIQKKNVHSDFTLNEMRDQIGSTKPVEPSKRSQPTASNAIHGYVQYHHHSQQPSLNKNNFLHIINNLNPKNISYNHGAANNTTFNNVSHILSPNIENSSQANITGSALNPNTNPVLSEQIPLSTSTVISRKRTHVRKQTINIQNPQFIVQIQNCNLQGQQNAIAEAFQSFGPDLSQNGSAQSQAGQEQTANIVLAPQSPKNGTHNFKANGHAGRDLRHGQKARDKYDEDGQAGSKVVQKVQEVKLERPESKVEQKKKKVVQFELSSQSFSRSQPTDTEPSQSYTESNSDLNKFKKNSSREVDQSLDNEGSIEEIDDQFQSFRISPSRQQSSSEMTITNDKSQSQMQVLQQDLTPQKIESAFGNIGSLRTSDGVNSRQVQSTTNINHANEFEQDDVAPQTGPTTSQIDLERIDSSATNLAATAGPQNTNIQAAMASILKQENDERVERERQAKRFEFSDAEEKFLEQKILEILERNKKKQASQQSQGQPQKHQNNEYSLPYGSAASTTTKALEPTESEMQTVQNNKSYEPVQEFISQPADQQIGQIISGQKQRSRMKDNIYRVGNKKQNTVEDKNLNNIVVMEASQQSHGPSHYQYMQGYKKPPIHCMTMTQTLLNKPQKSKKIGEVSSYITGSKSSQHSRKETSCNIDGSSIQPSLSPPQIAMEKKEAHVMKLKIKKLKSANNQSLSSEFKNLNFINKIKRGLEEVSTSQNQSCDPYMEASKQSLSQPSHNNSKFVNFNQFGGNRIQQNDSMGDNSSRDLLMERQILTGSKKAQTYSQEEIFKQAQQTDNQSKDRLTDAMYKQTEREAQNNANFITTDNKRVFDKKKQRFEKIRKMRGLSEEGAQSKSIEQSLQLINENYKLKGPSSTSLGAGARIHPGRAGENGNIGASMNQCDHEKLIQLSDDNNQNSSCDSHMGTPKLGAKNHQSKKINKTKFMKISENQSEETSQELPRSKSRLSDQNMPSNNNTVYSNYYNRSAATTGVGLQNEIQNKLSQDSRSQTAGRPKEQGFEFNLKNPAIFARFGNQINANGVPRDLEDGKSDNSIYGNPDITSTSSLQCARNQVKSPKILQNQPRKKGKIINQNFSGQYNQKSPAKMVQPLNTTKHEDFKKKLLANQIKFLHNSQQRQLKDLPDDNNFTSTNNNNSQQNYDSSGKINRTIQANDSKHNYYLAPSKSNPRTSINQQNAQQFDENFRLASKSIGGGSLGKDSTSTFSAHDNVSKMNNAKDQIIKASNKRNIMKLSLAPNQKGNLAQKQYKAAQRSSIESSNNLNLQQHIQLKLVKRTTTNDSSETYKAPSVVQIIGQHAKVVHHPGNPEDQKSSKGSLISACNFRPSGSIQINVGCTIPRSTNQNFIQQKGKFNLRPANDESNLYHKVGAAAVQKYSNGAVSLSGSTEKLNEEKMKGLFSQGEVGKKKTKKEKNQSVDNTNFQKSIQTKNQSTKKQAFPVQYVKQNHQTISQVSQHQNQKQKDRMVPYNNIQSTQKHAKAPSKTSIATKAPTPAPQMNAISSIAESMNSQNYQGFCHHPHASSQIPNGNFNNFGSNQNLTSDGKQTSSIIQSHGSNQFDSQGRQQSPFDYQGHIIRQQLYHNPESSQGPESHGRDQQPSLQSSPLGCSRPEKYSQQYELKNKKKQLQLQSVNMMDLNGGEDHHNHQRGEYSKISTDISGFGTSTNCKKNQVRINQFSSIGVDKFAQEFHFVNPQPLTQLSNRQLLPEYKQFHQPNSVTSQNIYYQSPLITPSGIGMDQSSHDEGDLVRHSKPQSLSKKSNLKTIGKQYMITSTTLKKQQQSRLKQVPQSTSQAQTVVNRLQSDQDASKYIPKNGNQQCWSGQNNSHSNAASIDKTVASEQADRQSNNQKFKGMIVPVSAVQSQKNKQKQIQAENFAQKQKQQKTKNQQASHQIKDAINLNKRKASVLIDNSNGHNMKLVQPKPRQNNVSHPVNHDDMKYNQLEKKESRGSIQSMSSFNMNVAGLIYYKNADTSVMNRLHQRSGFENPTVTSNKQPLSQSSQSPTPMNNHIVDSEMHGKISHNKYQSAQLNYPVVVNVKGGGKPMTTSDHKYLALKNQDQNYQQQLNLQEPMGSDHFKKVTTETPLQVYNSAHYNEPPQVIFSDMGGAQQYKIQSDKTLSPAGYPGSTQVTHNGHIQSQLLQHSSVTAFDQVAFSPQPGSHQPLIAAHPYHKGNFSSQNSHNSKSSLIDQNYHVISKPNFNDQADIMQTQQRRAINKKNVDDRSQIADAPGSLPTDKDLFYNMLEISKQTEGVKQNQKKKAAGSVNKQQTGQHNLVKSGAIYQVQGAPDEPLATFTTQHPKSNLYKQINSKDSLKSTSIEGTWKAMPVTLDSYYQSSQPANKKKVRVKCSQTRLSCIPHDAY